jgi:hypothetical protein
MLNYERTAFAVYKQMNGKIQAESVVSLEPIRVAVRYSALLSWTPRKLWSWLRILPALIWITFLLTAWVCSGPYRQDLGYGHVPWKEFCSKSRKIFFCLWAGVEPSPRILRQLIGLLYQPWIIDGDDRRAISRMTEWKGNHIRRNPSPLPLCPQIPHDSTRARTLTAEVGSRRLTASKMGP